MRTTTWQNIGVDVRGSSNVSDVLKRANLDYTVHKEQMMTPNGLIVPGRMATVATINGQDTVLGDVSDKYSICQNSEAFDFVDNISDELTFEKAGQTSSGMVYIIASLPELEVLDDLIKPYVILQNSHNGRYSLKSTITPLRIVCQNQFNYAFGHSENNISIIHSSNMMSKLNNAQILLSSVSDYMEAFNDNAIKLAGMKLSKRPEDIISQFFDMAIKGNESERVIRKIDENKQKLISIYDTDDNQNFKGTVWGMVNAYSDFVTHKEVKSTENADESKFLTVTFNPMVMNRFVDFVMSKAA